MSNWKEVTSELWKPAAGEEICGKFIGVEHNEGKEMNKVYHLKKEKSRNVKFFGSVVLDGLMRGIPLGTSLKIIYNGLESNPDGNDYKKWKVFVEEIPEVPIQSENLE